MIIRPASGHSEIHSEIIEKLGEGGRSVDGAAVIARGYPAPHSGLSE